MNEYYILKVAVVFGGIWFFGYLAKKNRKNRLKSEEEILRLERKIEEIICRSKSKHQIYIQALEKVAEQDTTIESLNELSTADIKRLKSKLAEGGQEYKKLVAKYKKLVAKYNKTAEENLKLNRANASFKGGATKRAQKLATCSVVESGERFFAVSNATKVTGSWCDTKAEAKRAFEQILGLVGKIEWED